MKKIFLIITILILVSPSLSFAQTTDEETTEKKTDIQKLDSKVDQIKDKVASRVAELKLVEKRGVVGIVESVNDNEIRINDLNDKTRIIEVDELTKYSSDEGSFDLSDVEKGTKISAIGLYNKDSGKLLARFVNEISIPVFLNGVISNKDEDGFTITLSTIDERDYTVDVEKITKSFSFSDGELETAGFAKLETMKNALVIGFVDPKDENRISASRIIIFPDVPKNPGIEVDTPEPSKTSSSPTPTEE